MPLLRLTEPSWPETIMGFRTASVPEVTYPREDHRQAQPVRRRNHFLVAHRAARLDHRRCSSLGTASRPSGKGKNASDAATQSLRGRTAFIAPNRAASTRLIWPGADAQGLPIAGIDNGIRLHVLAYAPGK